MINIDLLRKNPEDLKKSLARKGYKLDADAVLSLDETRRELIGEIENLRKKANAIAAKGKDTSAQDKEEGKELKVSIKTKEKELDNVEKQLNERLFDIPNPPLEDVPDGTGEKDNKEIRVVGEKPSFDFKPKDHLALGEELDIIDFKKGAKVVGSQFYYLKNEAAMLDLALITYALDLLRNKGFDILLTPDLAQERFYKGIGYMPKGEEAQTYEVADSNLGLIATAEITLAAYHADEILDEKKLPLKYAGFSHCFRKEGGAYGKYSKGLYRVHQFSKVEMFVFTKPEESTVMLEELLGIEEEILKELGLTYRVMEMSTGNLGTQAAKKYDLEAWMPGRGDWGEVTSTSNTTDYQARNLNIKYRANDKTDFVHTLNGTALATSRIPIAILENFQQKDGSVVIPKVLHKYLSFKTIPAK